MGWKYFMSELAFNLSVPIASLSTSGQGWEEPAWRIFLEEVEWNCITHHHLYKRLFTLCVMNNGGPVILLTLKWPLLLWSCRCHICAKIRFAWSPHTVFHEAGTAGWSLQNTCRGTELLYTSSVHHLYITTFKHFHKTSLKVKKTEIIMRLDKTLKAGDITQDRSETAD